MSVPSGPGVGLAIGAGSLGIVRVVTGGQSVLSAEVARIAIATGVLVVTLSLLGDASPELASSLGLMMVIGAVVLPGPAGTPGAGEALLGLVGKVGPRTKGQPGKPVAKVAPIDPAAPVRGGALG